MANVTDNLSNVASRRAMCEIIYGMEQGYIVWQLWHLRNYGVYMAVTRSTWLLRGIRGNLSVSTTKTATQSPVRIAMQTP